MLPRVTSLRPHWIVGIRQVAYITWYTKITVRHLFILMKVISRVDKLSRCFPLIGIRFAAENTAGTIHVRISNPRKISAAKTMPNHQGHVEIFSISKDASIVAAMFRIFHVDS